ncbi:MAG: hypothetical protein ABI758_02295 [Candidatus Woesebacteria bacterium]
MVHERERNTLSRREFLSLIAFLPLLRVELGDSRKSIQILRQNVDLYSPDQSNYELLRLNQDWDHFDDHDRQSPAVLEGAATRFAQSSIAISQFIVITDQLRLDRIKRAPSARELFLLQMRERMDRFQNGILLETNSDPILYLSTTSAFLEQEGLDGFVAMKSVEDFGKVGSLSIWNAIEEQWKGSLRVMVCNTATQATFKNLRSQEWKYDNFEVNMRWVIEVAYELFKKAHIPTEGEENNISAICRFTEEQFDTKYVALLPEYKIPIKNISSRFASLGRRLSSLLDSDVFLRDTMLRLNSIPEAQIDPSNLVAWLLHEAGLPLSKDASLEAIRVAMESTLPDSAVGIPHGNLVQGRQLQIWNEAGIISKKIWSTGRNDTLDDFKAGCFFVEEFHGGFGSQIQVQNGIVLNDPAKDPLFVCVAEGTLQKYTEAQMKENYLGALNRRLIFYY